MPRPRNPASPLKDKLAGAAYRLICVHGVEELTVSAVAKAAGVTANAPYFHYQGGATQLLAVVATRGFHELRELLARLPYSASARDRTVELVARYVEFGVCNANLYRAMFHQRMAEPLEEGTTAEKGEATYAELRELKLSTYEDLIAPLARLGREGSLRGRQDARGAPGLALAALAHGLVGEFIDEGLLRPAAGESPWSDERRVMTAEVTEVLLLGLLDDSAAARSDVAERAPAPLAPEDDPSWQLYSETILEFFPGERPVSIDLRRALAGDDLARLYERGLPDSFAVLTACNPRGRTVRDEENRGRDLELKERLRTKGQMWGPVDGVSPDGRHREAGVAVALSRDEAQQLARELEQSALFWFDGVRFWLVGALVEVGAVGLG